MPLVANAMTELLITARRGVRTPNLTRIKRRFRRILSELGQPEGELSVLLTDDAEIKQLNGKYRNVPKTTDVLSFSSRGGIEPVAPAVTPVAPAVAPVTPVMLGDIIISIPTAKRQAADDGSSLERETLFLLTHGLLHILGYDHERSPKEAEKMEKLQQKLMAIGYGA